MALGCLARRSEAFCGARHGQVPLRHLMRAVKDRGGRVLAGYGPPCIALEEFSQQSAVKHGEGRYLPAYCGQDPGGDA